MVREGNAELVLAAIDFHGAASAPLLPLDESPQRPVKRHEHPDQLLSETYLTLRDVAGRIGDFHQVCLARAIGAHEHVEPW